MASAPPPATSTSSSPRVLAGLGVALALLWIVLGRIFPVAVALMSPMLNGDAASSPAFAKLVQQANLLGRLTDQVLFALVLVVVLALALPVIGGALRESGQLRGLVLWLAIALLATSELLLLPVLAWQPLVSLPTDPYWLRQGAIVSYLALKGFAWLCVVAMTWPRKLDVVARWTLVGACWITIWHTGQQLADFNYRPEYTDWRPWGIAHLGSTLLDWKLVTQFALLTSLLALPGVLLVQKHAAEWLTSETEGEASGASRVGWQRWVPTVVAVVCAFVLLRPFDRLVMAATSTVAYPHLAELRFWAGHEKWSNFGAILNPPFADAVFWPPLLWSLGRALAEVAIARWAAESLARWAGYARGIPAFLTLIAVVVGPIAASAGLAYVGTQLQLMTWPWPPACSALPWLLVAFLVWQGVWPKRMQAEAVESPRPITLRLRMLAWGVAAIALYLAQEPLLLPPVPDEPVLWPTVAATKVLAQVDPVFPQRIAWLVGWHLPSWGIAGALAWLLLKREGEPATIASDE